MLANTIFRIALFAGLVASSPIDKRIVPTSVCKTVRSGNLRTTNGHQVTVFADGFVTVGGNITTHAEIQSCQPNFGGYDGKHGRPTGGHIYLPQFKRCITVAQTGTFPLVVTAAPCEFVDDSRQTFSNFIDQADGKIYFVGNTQADGSEIFHGDTCSSGYFGVKSSLSNNAALELSCVNDGHVVGFNV